MRSISIMLLLIFSVTAGSYAQDKIHYSSQNYVGLLEGESRAAFQLQTIHGVKFKTWHAGIGTGLDYYRFRTIPLFLDLNKDLVFNERTFFVSGDIGTNFVWDNGTGSMGWGSSESKFTPKLYWAGGLGYRAFFKNKREAFLINLGYSFKHVREELTVSTFCIDPPCTVSKDVYDNKLNRISIRVGLQF